MTSMRSTSELILGDQKSGKSRRAEVLAKNWLQQSPTNKAVFIATAQAWDEEMHQRIERHKNDRAQSVPDLVTVEEPLQLAQTITRLSQPNTLLVVDCLTLWLTNLLMPVDLEKRPLAVNYMDSIAMLSVAISESLGPLIIVSNEIGLGVVPMGREVRAFVDALGKLNQDMAVVCDRVTLMTAGLPLSLK